MILPREAEAFPGGIVVPVDKPYMWTSADVIRKLKFRAQRHFYKKNLKVGHAGTLDPLATGILLVCIGNATKRAEELQSHDKEYIADITFGATTPSYDLEKDIDREYPWEHITEDGVTKALAGFIGEQDQTAPLFSAKSIDGVRAYEIARRMLRNGDPGAVAAAEQAGVRSARIRIDTLELMEFGTALEPLCGTVSSHRSIIRKDARTDLPTARVRVVCSKGTYIRALARDLGESLGSGAHLSGLRRSRSGDFRLENALDIAEAAELFQENLADFETYRK